MINSTIRIVTLPPEDWEKYRLIRLKALKNGQTSFDITAEEEEKRINGDWEKEFLHLTAHQTGIVLFAMDQDTVIGMAGAQFGETSKTRHNATLFGVYIEQEYRNKGVGKLLVQKLLESLADVPFVSNVLLGVYAEHTNALSLYRSLGFIEIGVQHAELHYQNKYFDLILMEKCLLAYD